MTSNRTSSRITKSPRSNRRIVKRAAIGLAAVVVAGGALVSYASWQTENDIEAFRDRVDELGIEHPSAIYDQDAVAGLPAPVQHYFAFTFVGESTPMASVHMEMEGEFRRPQTEGFHPTTAEQTVAIGAPGMTFSARTSMAPGLWARAYDHYAEGEMEMKAKVMSTFTVVDESETPELNQTSLQRWLLESPLYPAALLPGGPVHWQAIDNNHARAIVSADGLEASLVATFRADGSIESFHAEHDGDLDTPYHGSGEYVLRSDERIVDGIRIPHRFTIGRAADGERYPFWTGEITDLEFIAG